MALNPLDNPLERLASLPNTMNWRGGWLATEQYYLNDVVVSPVNLASYILAGKTALLNGGDPTANPDWIELSAPTTGVQSVVVNPLTGIENTGTATLVNLRNTGVLTIGAGNTGIGITGGSGPFPLNTVITNDGVLSLTPSATPAGAGITVSANTGAIQIANNGILGITAGTGLASTGGQNPTLSIGASGLPRLSYATNVLVSGIAMTPNSVPAGGTGVLPFGLASPLNAFSGDLANGVPDPNGTWLLDLTKWSFKLIGPQVGVGISLSFAFVDNTTTAPVPIVYNPAIGDRIRYFPNGVFPFDFNLGQVLFDITAARALGMRTIDQLQIQNAGGTTLEFNCSGDVPCTYYPNGYT
jgi:hypothetical protein